MRRSLGLSLAAAASVLAFAVASGGAFSEDAEFDDMDGSQIVAAGAGSDDQVPKGLNSVPIDGLGSRDKIGANNRLVRQLMAARPNEDLVICVAGCFSDRDRVVYAQPIDRKIKLKPTAFADPSSDPVKPVEKSAVRVEVDSAAAPVSHDPSSPTILNGASDGTGGSSAHN